MFFISKKENDIKEIVEFFINEKLINSKKFSKNKSTIVFLSGNLGAGKTTFVKYFAKKIGIKNKINSPTFVIMKSYKINKNKLLHFEKLIHIDAYRLNNEKELKNLNWQEIISNPRNIIFIEWPENIKKGLPKNNFQIKILHLDENKRKFIFK